MLIYRVFFFNLVILIVRRFRGRGSVEGLVGGAVYRHFQGRPSEKKHPVRPGQFHPYTSLQLDKGNIHALAFI